MDHDAEQIQIEALATALGLPFAILDIAFHEAMCVKHPSAEGPPLFWLMHSPGHYDLVYPDKSYDVVKGGLVAVG
jgi:hypothetical protein